MLDISVAPKPSIVHHRLRFQRRFDAPHDLDHPRTRDRSRVPPAQEPRAASIRLTCSFGPVHVVYPEAGDERCTAALLVEVDPVGLVRNRKGPKGNDSSLDQYVNDRPYAASSFLSVAINKLFGTALTGRSKERPELADTPIPLSAHLPVAAVPRRRSDPAPPVRAARLRGRRRRDPARSGVPRVGRQPLLRRHPARDGPAAGRARAPLRAPARARRRQALLGRSPTRSTSFSVEAERGSRAHPDRELIARRYLRHDRRLTTDALARLLADEADDPDEVEAAHDEEEAIVEKPISLNDQRLAAVIERIQASGARRVVDLGCGEGKLVQRMLRDTKVGHGARRRRVVACAGGRVAPSASRHDGAAPARASRPAPGCAHLPRPRACRASTPPRSSRSSSTSTRRASARSSAPLFAHARPATVIVTTPNVEYNALFETLPTGTLRHRDHRFEWTRAEFEAWAAGVAERHGYTVRPRRHRTGRCRAWARRRRWRCSADEDRASRDLSPRRARRCLGLRQVDVRGPALPADRGGVVGLLPRASSATTRTTRPRPTRPSTCCTPSPASGWRRASSPSSTPPTCSPRRASRSSSWPSGTTCSPSRSCSTCPTRCATSATPPVPTATSAPHVLRNQRSQLRRSMRACTRGLPQVFVLDGAEEIDAATIEREPLWTDRRADHGPFDIIGDVHGCHDELVELLDRARLRGRRADGTRRASPGRAHAPSSSATSSTAGPPSPAVLRLAMNMVDAGAALCIPGQPREQAAPRARGRNVHREPRAGRVARAAGRRAAGVLAKRSQTFIDGLVSHSCSTTASSSSPTPACRTTCRAVRRARCAIVRALRRHDRRDRRVRPARALPVGRRLPRRRHGRLRPHARARRDLGQQHDLHRHRLRLRRPAHRAALARARARRPSTRTRRTTSRPGRSRPADGGRDAASRPTSTSTTSSASASSTTGLTGTVTIREENAAAALEVMSRFAVDPRWLVYLPPTMAPTATTRARRPARAPGGGVRLRSAATGVAARGVRGEAHGLARGRRRLPRRRRRGRRFGVADSAGAGAILTRTGRPFFNDAATERALLDRCAPRSTRPDLWDELATDWLVLDAELLPWSAKAEELLRRQYASVGAAATRRARRRGRDAATAALGRGVDVGDCSPRTTERRAMAERFVDAYRQLLLAGRRRSTTSALAPFQILAGEGKVHAAHRPSLAPRRARPARGRRPDDLPRHPRPPPSTSTTTASEAAAIAWWEELTGRGGEGMVVKPVDVVIAVRRASRSRASSAAGPSTSASSTAPSTRADANLSRLRARGLGHKRSLALREFALGIEALERFVARRTALPRARMRLRRARARERARRPETVTHTVERQPATIVAASAIRWSFAQGGPQPK